ncbi:MAG: TSUP family transporter [Anaerolineaceae bacterium]
MPDVRVVVKGVHYFAHLLVYIDVPSGTVIASSNFMIGFTAATSAIIYYQHSYIDPVVVVPTALDILLGAQVGSRLGGKIHSENLKKILSAFLVIFAVIMFVKAFTGSE